MKIAIILCMMIVLIKMYNNSHEDVILGMIVILLVIIANSQEVRLGFILKSIHSQNGLKIRV